MGEAGDKNRTLWGRVRSVVVGVSAGFARPGSASRFGGSVRFQWGIFRCVSEILDVPQNVSTNYLYYVSQL